MTIGAEHAISAGAIIGHELDDAITRAIDGSGRWCKDGAAVKRGESKPCVTCGRVITWRKKWERDWEQVKYCSQRCRGKLNATDLAIEQAILTLLAGRSKDATICPSEAAKTVEPEKWAGVMEPARRAARRLTAQGKIQITQGGKVVDPSSFRGPIRLRLAR